MSVTVRADLAFAACVVGILAHAASATLITATAVDETCDWFDASCWSHQPDPGLPVAPDNAASNYFTVRIDGGDAVSSLVDLAAATATIDRLEIDAADHLQLRQGALLTLQYDPARPGSGEVQNDGTLKIGTADSAARLEFAGTYGAYPEVAISGAGTIALSDNADNFIGVSQANQNQYRSVSVALGENQTLRGAGRLAIAQNHGTIEATGVNPLAIENLVNHGALRAVGPGGLRFVGAYAEIRNEGVIDVLDGSRISSEFVPLGEIINFGTLHIEGANTTAVIPQVTNGVLLEVLDGATLRSGYFVQRYGESPLFRIGAGSTFEGRATIEEGRVRIENGLIRSDTSFAVDGVFSHEHPRLEGVGRIELASPNPSIRAALRISQATLATGLDGVGRLDVDGDVRFLPSGFWEVDIAGTDVGAHDLLAVSGNTTFEGQPQFGTANRIELAYLPGFAPSAGDAIDILSSRSIASPTQPVESLFTAPDLLGDLYLAPEIAVEGAEQRLRLHVLDPILASWTADDGTYSDASGWSFSRPALAAIPDNAGLEVFDVQIGGSAGPATVALNSEVAINRLIVNAADALILGAGSRVILDKPLARSEAREVRNDGTISLSGGALTSENGLAFSGGGTVQLSEDGASYIGALGDDPIDIANGPAHTIEGAGSIRTTTSIYSSADRGLLSNAGIIAATGANALEIDARVQNDGVMSVEGAGGIDITQELVQRGQLRIASGSQVKLADYDGVFRQDAVAAVTEIGRDAVLSMFDARVDSGRVSLDGGTIEIRRSYSPTLTIGAQGLLEGDGSILVSGGSLTVLSGGAIASGLAGIGRLDVDGNLDLRSGARLHVDLGGASSDLHDEIEASKYAAINGAVSISLLGGFTPAHGDVIDLIHASTVTGTPYIEGSALGGGLFLVPEIHNVVNAGGTLAVRAKRGVEATWSGPSGDYFSASWRFSAPVAAVAPNNDDLDIFDVEIGGTDPADVTLGSTARIESLSLGRGSSLDLGSGASLTLLGNTDREQSGRVANEGTIRIGSASAVANLRNEGDLEISGSGVIELGSTSMLGTGGTLINGSDHTIRGAGRFARSGTFHNLGTVEATASAGMSIGFFANDGAIRALGTGGLSLGGGTNRGVIESAAGSIIRSFGFNNEGRIDVYGSYDGSDIANNGLLDVHAGGSATTGIRQTSEDAVTHVAGALIQARGSSLAFENGLLDLDGGTITITDFGISIGPEAVLAGAGAIRRQAGVPTYFSTIMVAGELSPGHGGVGALELAGPFMLAESGSISIELAGTDPSQHDLVTVLGTSILRGTIAVKLLTGDGAFAPVIGDVFDILAAQAIDDDGFSFELPDLAGALEWWTGIVEEAGIARLRLVVVPEPGTAGLVLLGLALLARAGRRSR